MAKVDIYQDKADQWRWRVQADNGEIVATGEGHTRREDAERAFLTAADAVHETSRQFWTAWGVAPDLPAITRCESTGPVTGDRCSMAVGHSGNHWGMGGSTWTAPAAGASETPHPHARYINRPTP